MPIDANKEFVGNLWTLLNPMALLGGLVTLSLFLVHGALFVALKTAGPIRDDARRLATRLGVEDDDEERWLAMPDDDPRAQAHDIYEWVGFLQETVIEALTS